MKWLSRFIIAVIILALAFFIWLNHMRTAILIQSHDDQYSAVALYIDDRPVDQITALLERDQRVFIDLAALASERADEPQLSEDGDYIIVPASAVDASARPDLLLYIPILSFAEHDYIDSAYLPRIGNYVMTSAEKPYRLYSKNHVIHYAYTDEDAALRTAPDDFSAQLKVLPKLEKVYLMAEAVGYYLVRTKDDDFGYIARRQLDDICEEVPSAVPRQSRSQRQSYGRLQWTFSYFKDYNALIKSAPSEKVDGLDGLVPNFFELSNDGHLINRADFGYVERAHQLGYAVYANVGNAATAQGLQRLLASEDAREGLVEQLRIYCQLYQLDGVNLNFGHLDSRAKFNYLQFVKQLYSALSEDGVILSVAVLPDQDDAIAQCVDYNLIAKFCDYVLFMAYEEYDVNSEVAGSVATVDWTRRQLDVLLEQTPAKKVVLGIPTYMRLWRDQTAQGGIASHAALSQSAVAMKSLLSFLQKYDYQMSRDKVSGQNYYEMFDGAAKLKLWAEDDYSVIRRLQIVRDYKLAGVVSWRMGLESENFWRLVRENLDK